MLWWFWKITAAVVTKLSPSDIMESIILFTLLFATTYFLHKPILTLKILPSLPDQASTRFHSYPLQANDYGISTAGLNNLFPLYPSCFVRGTT